MKLFQVEKPIVNYGRYFYKCPRNVDHPHSFLWCDVWHEHDPPENLPMFLQLPQQSPHISPTTQVSSSSRAFTQNVAPVNPTCKSGIEVDSSLFCRSQSLVQDVDNSPTVCYGLGETRNIGSNVILCFMIALMVFALLSIALLGFLVGRLSLH